MGLLDDYGPLLQGVKKIMPPGTNPSTGLADLYSAKSMPPGTNPFPTPLQPKMDFGYGEPGFSSSKAGMPAIPLDDPPSTKIGGPMRPDENYGSLPPLSETADIRDALRPSPGPPHYGVTPAQRQGAKSAFTDMDFGVGDPGFGGKPPAALGMITPPPRPPGLGSGPGTDMADAPLGVIKPPVRPPGLGTGLLANAPLPPVRPPDLGTSATASTPITPPPIAPIAPPIAPPPAAAASAPIGGGGGGGAAGGLGGIFSGLAGIAQGIGGGGGPAPPEAKAPTLQPMSPDPRAGQRAQGAQQIMSGILGGSDSSGLLDDPRKRRRA